MIASVFRVPAGSPASDPATVRQVSEVAGVVHLFLLTPPPAAGPEQDRLSVIFWEKEEQLDAYIESDLGQQVLAANPNASRTTYVVDQVR